MEYPKELHDAHNDFVLAPETMSINKDDLSAYNLRLLGQKPFSTQVRLTPNFHNKMNYVVHYRNLKYYLEKGLVLKKVNRVLSFKQKAYMKPFIEKISHLRSISSTKFDKDLYKLLQNSVFGKCIENVTMRRNIKLVSEWDKALKLISKPSYKNFIKYADHLIGNCKDYSTI